MRSVAFLCFMDNFFFLLSFFCAYNGLSLPWLDTIHDFGGGGGCAERRGREGGGGGEGG